MGSLLRRRTPTLTAALLAAFFAAACSSTTGHHGSAAGTPGTTAAGAPGNTGGPGSSPAAPNSASPTPIGSSDKSAAPVWLCQPGTANDPCTSDLDAAAVAATGAKSVQHTSAASNPPIDCFYVYPTVSPEKGANADLTIQPAEIATARAQASRFSSVCRVWAPMYRQVTVAGLFTANLTSVNTAYDSLLGDWTYYLQHINDGRPFVLIGHSQGAAMLIRLISQQVDPNPSLRARLVAAILAGGNLQVPTNQTVGATFKHIPLCTSTTTDGCAIAYSTFGSPPPSDALFGRPGQGVSLLSLQTTSAGQQVACVNPAALTATATPGTATPGTAAPGTAAPATATPATAAPVAGPAHPTGPSAPLTPYFPQSGSVPWVTYPGLYTASCRSAGGATWLQVDANKAAGDTRPVVSASLGPTWGFHVDDVSLPLGNLVSDVAALATAHHA